MSAGGAMDGVMVLGMHRSGTSAVTRVLSLLGLSTCRPLDLIGGLPGNDRGHWESRSLTLLNEALLEALGGSWWQPPSPEETMQWVAALSRTRADELRDAHRAAHPEARPWVWKDPRLCVLLPVWRAVLGNRHATVLVIRHPLAIADSLAVRNGASRPAALDRWERYLNSALVHLEGSPVWIARYDDLLADPEAWCEEATQVLRSNGLELAVTGEAMERVKSFLTEELRHHVHRPQADSSELSDRQRRLWERLDASVGHHPRLSLHGQPSP